MSFMTSYLTPEEARDLAYESALNFKIAQAIHEMDALYFEHVENISKIEIKVMEESGSEDDLLMLYEAEAEENAEKGKGILVRLLDVVKKLFSRTFNFFKNSKEEPEKDVTLQDDPDVIFDTTNKTLNQFNDAINGKAIAEIISIPALITGGFLLKKAMVKSTKEKGQSLSQKVLNAIGIAQNKIQNADTPEKQSTWKKLLSNLTTLGNRLAKIQKATDVKGEKDTGSTPSENPKEDLERAKQEVQELSAKLDNDIKQVQSLAKSVKNPKLDKLRAKFENDTISNKELDQLTEILKNSTTDKDRKLTEELEKRIKENTDKLAKAKQDVVNLERMLKKAGVRELEKNKENENSSDEGTNTNESVDDFLNSFEDEWA